MNDEFSQWILFIHFYETKFHICVNVMYYTKLNYKCVHAGHNNLTDDYICK